MFKLVFTESYLKNAKKFIKRHPMIRQQYRKTLELLEIDPWHPSLRLHALQGKLSGLQSVSVNLQYRIVIELIVEEEQIILLNIGSHEQVY